MHPNLTTHERRHVARIEAMEGVSFSEAVQRRYFDERTAGHVLCSRWGLQYRSFRSLLLKHGIDMKTASHAVAETWIDADDRRADTADRMRQTMASHDFSGERNNAKRPEVRAKISAAKMRDNPAKRPEVRAKMSMSRRAFYATYPERHPNRFWGRHRRSKIERMMDAALHEIGIDALHGQRIGRRWPDLMIPSARLVIECDGRYWHTPEADAARDAELNAAGWHVLHFTDDQIVTDAARCAAVVAKWLNDHTDAP